MLFLLVQCVIAYFAVRHFAKKLPPNQMLLVGIGCLVGAFSIHLLALAFVVAAITAIVPAHGHLKELAPFIKNDDK